MGCWGTQELARRPRPTPLLAGMQAGRQAEEVHGCAGAASGQRYDGSWECKGAERGVGMRGVERTSEGGTQVVLHLKGLLLHCEIVATRT